MTAKTVTTAIRHMLDAIDAQYESHDDSVRYFRKRAFLGDNAYSTLNSANWHQRKQLDVQGEIREMLERGGAWGEAQDNALDRKTEFYTTLEQREELFRTDHEAYKAAYKELTGEAWLPRAGSRDVEAKERQTAARHQAQAILDKIAAHQAA